MKKHVARRARGNSQSATTPGKRERTPERGRADGGRGERAHSERKRAEGGRSERSVGERKRAEGAELTRGRGGKQKAATKAPTQKKVASPTLPLHELPRTLPTERSSLAKDQYLLTCRSGSEQDLIDELLIARVKHLPIKLADALVVTHSVPKRDRRPVELTFARQGFPIAAIASGAGPESWLRTLLPALRVRLGGKSGYALQVWSPDSEAGNRLAPEVEQLDTLVSQALAQDMPQLVRGDDAMLRRAQNLPFAQIAVLDRQTAVLGVTHANQALSLAPGGRTRVRVGGPIPSRAARKLEEAFAWLAIAPGPGELCVDLGAAPGGWTYVLSERRARVIAVDPGQLRADLMGKRNIRHLAENAFTFAPSEPVDWLFCDMAYRPLEVAALLAKWGRRRWARILVANIKLPMTRKAEILERVKHILRQEGDFKNVRSRQLYHDRDEITLCAHVG